jgi:hypothetical protein
MRKEKARQKTNGTSQAEDGCVTIENLVDALIRAVEFYHAHNSEDRTEIEERRKQLLSTVTPKE